MQYHFLVLLLVAVVCDARTVLWTAAGGNPLWNNAGNWDCLCLPTSADDVVIDLQAIPGNVQIGGVRAPALCNSLTIGGTSRFTQTLTVTGALTIGPGGAALNSNGVIDIETSPDAPVWTSGQFISRGGKFIFATGSLTGTGSFVFPAGTLLNFTGAAAKGISTTIQVAGSAVISSPVGTALQLTKGGQLIIDGTFKAPASLSLSSDNNSTFYVNKGIFSFTGSSLTIQGSATLNSWSLGPISSATLINSVTSRALSLSAGANLTLIGSPTDKRVFQAITGAGTIKVQGGSNIFNSIQGVSRLEATGGVLTVVDASVGTFVLAGASVSGQGTLTAVNSAFITGTLLGGLKVNAGYLTLSGVVNVNDDGTTVTVNKGGVIVGSSQITLTGGSQFVLSPGASVTQSGDLKFVQGPPTKTNPSIAVFGSWTSNNDLAIFSIPVIGTGSFSVSLGRTLSLTNVAFSAGSVSVAGSVQLSQGVFNVTTVKGDGSISGSPVSFNVRTLDVRTFGLLNGLASADKTSIQQLTISGGSFAVTSSLSFGNLILEAGSINGPRSNPSQVSGVSTTIKGTTFTLNNVILTTASVNWNCGGSCQFFTNNAVFKTSQ